MLVGYATVALALILDPSGGLFSDAARPCQRPAPPFGANVAVLSKNTNELEIRVPGRTWTRTC